MRVLVRSTKRYINSLLPEYIKPNGQMVSLSKSYCKPLSYSIDVRQYENY